MKSDKLLVKLLTFSGLLKYKNFCPEKTLSDFLLGPIIFNKTVAGNCRTVTEKVAYLWTR